MYITFWLLHTVSWFLAFTNIGPVLFTHLIEIHCFIVISFYYKI